MKRVRIGPTFGGENERDKYPRVPGILDSAPSRLSPCGPPIASLLRRQEMVCGTLPLRNEGLKLARLLTAT
jgi:hypothetical protein